MPRIRSRFLKCVFYLYKTPDDAKVGRPNGGGTGFIAAVSSNNAKMGDHYYAVSNRHVAIDGGASVIRLATHHGGTDVLETDPADWEKHPGGRDIAATPIYPNRRMHSFTCIRSEPWGHAEYLQTIGVGDDVFMVGRFVDHDGVAANRASARFGNISSMPVEKNPTSEFDHSYILDIHSRTGYSGSPVFVYRTPGGNFEPAHAPPSNVARRVNSGL